MALAGSDLSIEYSLVKPANQSEDRVMCYDPDNNIIHSSEVARTAMKEERISQKVKLKKLQSSASGEYRCTYRESNAYWFLLVRDEGYHEPDNKLDSRELITVGVFTFVLLVFSVVGSVYVFRGRWNKPDSEGGSSDRRQEENRNERRSGEVEEDNMDIITAPSSSFYASLEPRPRSIYDVLDHSAANREAGQRNAKPKSKESHSVREETMQDQDESVYENF